MSSATGYHEHLGERRDAAKATRTKLAFGAVLASSKDFFWRLNVTGDRTRSQITQADCRAVPDRPGEQRR